MSAGSWAGEAWAGDWTWASQTEVARIAPQYGRTTSSSRVDTLSGRVNTRSPPEGSSAIAPRETRLDTRWARIVTVARTTKAKTFHRLADRRGPTLYFALDPCAN